MPLLTKEIDLPCHLGSVVVTVVVVDVVVVDVVNAVIVIVFDVVDIAVHIVYLFRLASLLDVV